MEKQILFDCIDRCAPVLTGISDAIWDYAELSMQERRSAQCYCEALEREGFTVERNLCGIPTAFSGSFGSGAPRIGILGEFDALSGLSQLPGAVQQEPLTPGGNGHGCGHNLLGAASFGAAVAIKRTIEAGQLSGTVIFYGCPGEEGCAGKVFMARGGLFRDLDAALAWHPGNCNEIMVGSNAACMQVEYTFRGISAHAANDPYLGRSALDAVELMHVGTQYLREHMPPNSSVHYSITDAGGVSPNVVQSMAKTVYMVRGETVRKAKELLGRVEKIARGAALMTETEVSSRQIDGMASTLPNETLERLLHKNMCLVSPPQYTPEEWEFARKLHDTCPPGLPGIMTDADKTVREFVREHSQGGQRAMNDFVIPYVPSARFYPGSTDVGDVSWLTPTAQFTTATWVAGSPGHSWQNVSIGRTSIAHKGMLQAAKILAATAADLMEDPSLLSAARREFDDASSEGYDCPITEDVTF